MSFSRTVFLKFAVIGLLPLLLASCQSVDQAIDDMGEGIDIMGDTFDDTADTVSSFPSGSEDYLKSNCPSVKLVDELGTFADFTDFRSPNESNLITRVKVGKLSSSCTYTEKSVTVDMALIFDGLLGPAARRGPTDTFFSYPFFVAITTPSNVIMAREIFAAPMTYGPGQVHQVHHENMRQIIPITKEMHGPGYSILVGFQLNKQQLAYSRAVQKTQKKIAAQNAKATKAAAKNAPPVMPLRDDMIIQQQQYQTAPQPMPMMAPPGPPVTAPLQPVQPTPLMPPPGR